MANRSSGDAGRRDHRSLRGLIAPDTRLDNTLIAGNFQGSTGSRPGDVKGPVDTRRAPYNLIGDGSNLTGIVNNHNGNQVGTAAAQVNPVLGPLAGNGGGTQTLSLLPGSPAIDAGSNALAVLPDGTALATDQRGMARVFDTTVDIGAVESTDFVVTTLADPATPTASGSSLRQAIVHADQSPGATISFAAGLTGTIVLGSALPDLSASVTIAGPGASVLTVQGGGPSSNWSRLSLIAA